MQKHREVYKVVKVYKTRLLSASYFGHGLYVEYILNRTTFPIMNTNALYCFDTLENAKSFVSMRNNMRIYKAIAYNCYKPKDVSNIDNVIDYWFSKLNGHKSKHAIKAPTGTLACYSLELIERVL